ncbi:MAG: SDR family oxidoreductase [Phycisphaerales bacterium]
MESILITGVSGFIGSRLAARLSAEDGLQVSGASRTRPPSSDRLVWNSADLSRDDGGLHEVVRSVKPDLIVHAAAVADLAACERAPAQARAVNVDGTRRVIDAAASVDARLIHVSTDQVFDGTRGGYRETDKPSPLHEYGRTKHDAERLVLEARESGRPAIIVRLPLVYGTSPTTTRSASEQLLRIHERCERARLFIDEYRSPILVDDFASCFAEIIRTSPEEWPDILHLAGPERVSRFNFGVALAEIFELGTSWIDRARQRDLPLSPPRPADLSLDTTLARARLDSCPRGVRAGLTAWRDELRGSEVS